MKGFCAGRRRERLGERKLCAPGPASGLVYLPTRDAVSEGPAHALRFWGAALSDADLRTVPHRQKGPRVPDKEAVAWPPSPARFTRPSGAPAGPETSFTVFAVA